MLPLDSLRPVLRRRAFELPLAVLDVPVALRGSPELVGLVGDAFDDLRAPVGIETPRVVIEAKLSKRHGWTVRLSNGAERRGGGHGDAMLTMLGDIQALAVAQACRDRLAIKGSTYRRGDHTTLVVSADETLALHTLRALAGDGWSLVAHRLSAVDQHHQTARHLPPVLLGAEDATVWLGASPRSEHAHVRAVRPGRLIGVAEATPLRSIVVLERVSDPSQVGWGTMSAADALFWLASDAPRTQSSAVDQFSRAGHLVRAVPAVVVWVPDAMSVPAVLSGAAIG